MVEERAPNLHGRTAWSCRCKCGTVKIIQGILLTSNHTVSCGCYRKNLHTVHGLARTREYKTYYNILQRCLNPKNVLYWKYGGKGVTVCKRWQKSFKNFYADMGPRPSPKHSINRKNGKKGYSPRNCAWATKLEQSNNKISNRFIEISGERYTIAQAAVAFKINRETLAARLQAMTPEEAVTTPVKPRHKSRLS